MSKDITVTSPPDEIAEINASRAYIEHLAKDADLASPMGLCTFYAGAVASFDHQLALLDQQYEKLKAIITDRRQALALRFEQEVKDAAKQIISQAKGKPKKYVDTLQGRIQFRTNPGRYDWSDKDKAMEWLEEHCPSAIKAETHFKIEKTPMKEAIEEYVKKNDGEIPDGFEWIPDIETMKVVAGKIEDDS